MLAERQLVLQDSSVAGNAEGHSGEGLGGAGHARLGTQCPPLMLADNDSHALSAGMGRPSCPYK